MSGWTANFCSLNELKTCSEDSFTISFSPWIIIITGNDGILSV